MLIHVTPKFHLPHLNDTLKVDLIELRINELNLVLKRGRDLVTRKPYENQNLHVGCRSDAPDCIDGILVETDASVSAFTAVARWLLGGVSTVTHHTTYVLLDHQFDATSDKMALWTSRWPDCHRNAMPGAHEPRMDIWPPSVGGRRRTGNVQDTYGPDGFICERHETFAIPTMERHLLMESWRLMSQQQELALS